MDNFWPVSDTSGFIMTAPYGNGGGYNWVIPGYWKVKGSGIATNTYGSWTSTKFIYPSGTAECSKFGWLDNRTTNGAVTLTNYEFRVTPGY